MNQCFIRPPTTEEWPRITKLLVDSFPNAVVSLFGLNFAARYYQHIAAGPDECILAAFDSEGTLAGVVIGTVDRKRTRQLPFGFILRLLVSASYRLFSLGFFLWIVNSYRTETKATVSSAPLPQAELLEIVVDSRFRGLQLAFRLLERIEAFFREKGVRSPYIILTEKTNHVANSFYQNVGARFAGTNLFHGKQINEWHKDLAAAESSSPPQTISLNVPKQDQRSEGPGRLPGMLFISRLASSKNLLQNQTTFPQSSSPPPHQRQ